ncbi:AAA family ATPase [uncultured Leptotrichia sp.]|uniref:AAA family ATPase n=1 Tax=uncultured Leptotrichia sp. TaxID=159271 RepID=UPI0025E293CD|nr:ATP-binding protein [uncultured Leptotrichia sp.]
MKIKKVLISNYKNLKNLKMNFEKNDEILDLIVLTGSNGSGKTRILECVLSCFENYINSNYQENKNRLDISFQENEKKCFEGNFDLGMFFKILNSYNWKKAEPFILGDDSKKDDFFEKEKILSDNLKIFPKIIYVPTEINFQKMNTASTTLVQKYKFINIVDTNLIKDIPSYIATKIITAIFQNKNKKVGDVQKKVFDEINEIFGILDIDVKIEDISQDGRNIPIFKNSAGDKFDINELSSGEKQLFLRTLAIRMLNPENSIILIDEPELSLHPKWQQRIVDVYRKIGKNNQIIIATHSPHILGSVRKENIMLLDKDDEGKIVVRTGDELYDSYGQPTDRVLKDIMGLQTTRNPKVFKLLEEVRKIVDRDEYNSDKFKEKYRELKGILGSKDEDIFLIDMDIKIRKKRGLKNAESK